MPLASLAAVNRKSKRSIIFNALNPDEHALENYVRFTAVLLNLSDAIFWES
jgi:hypothetical protein